MVFRKTLYARSIDERIFVAKKRVLLSVDFTGMNEFVWERIERPKMKSRVNSRLHGGFRNLFANRAPLERLIFYSGSRPNGNNPNFSIRGTHHFEPRLFIQKKQ